MYDFAFYFMLFIGFSIFGWILECLSCSLWYHKIIYDRGFLLGPYCPIYGVGAVGGYLFLGKYANEPIALFTLAAVGSSIIEYLTSVVMEKLFKARWWDYSNQPFNLEGRVCLKNSILFGILGLAFVYYVKPFYENLVDKISNNTLITLTIILLVVFIIDCIISFILMSKIKKNIVNVKHDSTSDIDKATRELLKSYHFYFKPLFKSFPSLTFNVPSGEKIVASISTTLNNFDTKNHKKKENKSNKKYGKNLKK